MPVSLCLTAGSGKMGSDYSDDKPLANEAGIEVLSSARDYDKVRRDLALLAIAMSQSPFSGRRGNSVIPLISQVGADQLRRAGLNVSRNDWILGQCFVASLSRETSRKGRLERLFRHIRPGL